MAVSAVAASAAAAACRSASSGGRVQGRSAGHGRRQARHQHRVPAIIEAPDEGDDEGASCSCWRCCAAWGWARADFSQPQVDGQRSRPAASSRSRWRRSPARGPGSAASPCRRRTADMPPCARGSHSDGDSSIMSTTGIGRRALPTGAMARCAAIRLEHDLLAGFGTSVEAGAARRTSRAREEV